MSRWLEPLPALADKMADWQMLAAVGGQPALRARVVVDLGPGFGFDALMLRRWAKAYIVLDNDREVLDHVCRVEPGVVPLLGSCRSIPFPDGGVGMVLDFGTIDNCAEPDECYIEAARILEPDGLLLTSFANLRYFGGERCVDGETRQDPEELAKRLKSWGLEVVYEAGRFDARARIAVRRP